MSLSFHKNGDLIGVDTYKRKSSLKDLDEFLKENNIFKKTFINYFSLGFDARVGFGFDKNRSSSRCWNKMIYAWEGMKKNCCTKSANMNNVIDRFEELEENKSADNNNKVEVLDKEDLKLNQIELKEITKNNNDINSINKYKNFKRKVIFYGNNKEKEKEDSK